MHAQSKHDNFVSRKIMRFSFLENVYQEEKKMVMYAFCVCINGYASFYIFATLITRGEKHENFERNVFNMLYSVFSRTFEGPEPYFIFSCGKKPK